MGSSSGGSQTQSQTSAPWSGAQPHLTQAMNAAQQVFNHSTYLGPYGYPNSGPHPQAPGQPGTPGTPGTPGSPGLQPGSPQPGGGGPIASPNPGGRPDSTYDPINGADGNFGRRAETQAYDTPPQVSPYFPGGPYPGQTVVDMDPRTMLGIHQLTNRALNPSGNYANFEAGIGQMGQQPNFFGRYEMDRFAQGQNLPGVHSAIQQQAGGMVNPFLGQFNQFSQTGGAGQNQYEGQLGSFSNAQTMRGTQPLEQAASGQFLGGNPHTQSRYNNASQEVANQLNSRFSAAGRTGSAAHQGAVARELGGLHANMFGDDYNRERAYQMQAGGQLAGLQQGDLSRQGSTLGALLGNREGQFNRQLDASGMGAGLVNQDYGRQLQAAGMAQSQANQNLGYQMDAAGFGRDTSQMGNSNLMNAIGAQGNLLNQQNQMTQGLFQGGQTMEQQRGLELQDAMDRWNFPRQNAMDMIEWYNAIATGQGQLGGQSMTTTRSRLSPLQTAIGIGSTIGSFF